MSDKRHLDPKRSKKTEEMVDVVKTIYEDRSESLEDISWSSACRRHGMSSCCMSTTSTRRQLHRQLFPKKDGSKKVHQAVMERRLEKPLYLIQSILFYLFAQNLSDLVHHFCHHQDFVLMLTNRGRVAGIDFEPFEYISAYSTNFSSFFLAEKIPKWAFPLFISFLCR